MGDVTKEQRNHIAKELRELEKRLSHIKGVLEDPKKFGKYTVKFYDLLLKEMVSIFDDSMELAKYINDRDSDEPPFNLFKGDLQLANHAMPTTPIQSVTATIDNIKHTYFENDRMRVADANFDEDKYAIALSEIRYCLNCLSVFRKLASGRYAIEKFQINEVLDRVIKDRQHIHHHNKFVFNSHIENLEIDFDREFLYWIAMRMLSNAERATKKVDNAWIRIQTYRHNDGNQYLIVRNNGQTIEERAQEALARDGGKSLPNILKMCEAMGSEFKLKGFPDHTRACLRLPLAESKK